MADASLRFGLDMAVHHDPLGFSYGDDVMGPMAEIRTLDQIRASLRDPNCEGPHELYAIAMDVARLEDRDELKKRMLLFGVVTYAAGKVLVPPGWGHATISASVDEPLTFGAWCDREYGFEYDAVRARKGLAWYPLVQDEHIIWQHNPHYVPGRLQVITARRYSEFGITDAPLYQQFIDDPARFQFISNPGLAGQKWVGFHP